MRSSNGRDCNLCRTVAWGVRGAGRGGGGVGGVGGEREREREREGGGREREGGGREQGKKWKQEKRW